MHIEGFGDFRLSKIDILNKDGSLKLNLISQNEASFEVLTQQMEVDEVNY